MRSLLLAGYCFPSKKRTYMVGFFVLSFPFPFVNLLNKVPNIELKMEQRPEFWLLSGPLLMLEATMVTIWKPTSRRGGKERGELV